MSIADRRAREKASLRREILRAARQMFVEQGYEAVTMRRIADRIEYSPTTIYLYFRDKEELFRELCEETFRELAARLTRLARRGLPPLDYLREGLRLYCDFGLKHPSDYTLTFTHGPKAHGDYRFDDSIGKQAFGKLHEGVIAAQASGDLCPGDPAAAAQALWCACHGVVSLLLAHPQFPFVPRRRLIDHTIDTMIAGLRPR